MPNMIRLHAWLCSLLCAFVLTAARAEPVHVVASFSILADIVSQVGGEHVRVTALVGAEQDAHVFQPRPSDAALVAKADLVVINGLGFEGWIERFIQSTGYRGPLRVAAEGVAAMSGRTADGHRHGATGSHAARPHGHEHDPHHHAHAGAPGGEPPDPHAWQNPLNVAVYARNVAAALAEVDPGHADAYRGNAERYARQLHELDAWIAETLAAIPPARRKVITSHAAMGYFGARYGVTFLAPQGLSTASEPSAREVAALIRQIRAEGVSALFLESVTNAALLRQIAAEAGVALGGRLYSDALSAPGGVAPTYLQLMRHNVQSLAATMRPH